MKLLLLLMLFSSSSFAVYSQQNDLEQNNSGKRYIKIVLASDVTSEQEQEITLAFKQFPGVQTSRMDNTTRTYLGIYSPAENLLDETFLNWFENHGYTVKCYYDADYSQGNMMELSKKNCH